MTVTRAGRKKLPTDRSSLISLMIVFKSILSSTLHHDPFNLFKGLSHDEKYVGFTTRDLACYDGHKLTFVVSVL